MKTLLRIIALISFIFISNNSQAQIFGNGVATGKHFCKTSDGGYMLCGKDGVLIYIVKVDSVGHYQWSKYFPAEGTADCIVQTTDDGYLMITTRDFLNQSDRAGLFRLDANGDTLWTKLFQNGNGNYGVYVDQLTDGNFMIGFVVDDINHFNPFTLMKADSAGNSIWNATLNPGGLFGGYASSICRNSQGGWAGTSSEGTGPSRILGVTAVDSTGNATPGDWIEDSLWNINYYGYGICESPDSGYLVVGKWDSVGVNTNGQFLYIKYDKFLDTVWSKQWGGAGNDFLTSVKRVPAGGYIMSGHTASLGQYQNDIMLIRIDDAGDTLWTKTYGGSGNEEVNYLDITNSGGYVMIGDSNTYNMWLIITDSLGNVLRDTSTTWISNIPKDNINVFPNPAHESFFINGLVAKGRLEIYDSRSALVQTMELNNLFLSKNEINLSVPPGTYTLKIYNGKNIITRTIIKE